MDLNLLELSWYKKPVASRTTPGTSLVAQWLRVCQCRGHRFDFWSRKIPCAMGQPSLCAMNPCSRAREPQLLKSACFWTRALQQEKPQQWEACVRIERVAPAHHNQRKPGCNNEEPCVRQRSTTQPKRNKHTIKWNIKKRTTPTHLKSISHNC